MKIVIDLSYIFGLDSGGKTQVSFIILKGLLKTAPDNEYVIICNNNIQEYIKENFPAVKTMSLKNYFKSGKDRFKNIFMQFIRKNIIIPYKINKENPDVVFFPHDRVCLFNLYKKFKTVMLPHDIQPISNPKKWPLITRYHYKLYYLQDFKYMKKIIAISDADNKEMETFFPKYIDKINKIYNPLDTDAYEKYTFNSIKQNTIVAVNYIFPHKNIMTLLKAFHSICDKIEKYNLILIGRTTDDVVEYVKSNKLEERIIITGFIEEDEKNKYLLNCRLYVNPTLFEGFGMTAVEAIMLGAPCLLSDIPVNREVTMGFADFYSPPDDSKILANKILDLLSEKPNDDELKNRAKIVAQKYNYINAASEYVEIFTRDF